MTDQQPTGQEQGIPLRKSLTLKFILHAKFDDLNIIFMLALIFEKHSPSTSIISSIFLNKL